MRASSIATRRERAAFFAAAILIAVIFTCLRLVLLQVRSPFFDELFTVWISRRSPGGILRGLLLDSGPPLYYWMVFWPVHAARGLRSAIAEVPELRLISLLFAVVTLLSVLGRSRLGESRWMAAILLTFFPASVYFSGEARAYALCAMFVAFGVLALERWASEDEGGSVALSLLWFFLAACSHYYGALFLAVPLVVALIVRRRRMITDAVIGTVIAGVLYAPLLWLASRQPPEAIRWMAAEQQQPGQIVLTMLHHLGFAAPFPAVFLPPPPAWVQILSLAAVILALTIGSIRSDRARIFGAATVVPLALVAIAAFAGRTIYFPLRFESVLAVPLMLWLAFSLRELPAVARSVIVTVLVVTGGFAIYNGVLDHRARPDHPFRTVAELSRAKLPDRARIVVSGLEYLEIISQRDRTWSPEVITFPTSQQTHPGWRSETDARQLSGEAASLSEIAGDQFFWIGEVGSGEQQALSERFALRPLFSSGPMIVAMANRRR